MAFSHSGLAATRPEPRRALGKRSRSRLSRGQSARTLGRVTHSRYRVDFADSDWMVADRSLIQKCTRIGSLTVGRFYSNLPKTQINLNKSMSALACWRKPALVQIAITVECRR